MDYTYALSNLDLNTDFVMQKHKIESEEDWLGLEFSQPNKKEFNDEDLLPLKDHFNELIWEVQPTLGYWLVEDMNNFK